MTRVASQKVTHRLPRRRVTARKQKLPEVTPPPPPPTEAQRHAALSLAHGNLRQRLWNRPGTLLTQLEEVSLHSAWVPRGRPHWHLLTEGLGRHGYELSLRGQKGKEIGRAD